MSITRLKNLLTRPENLLWGAEHLMGIVTWSSRFETGIELVDQQHRTLFDAVNRLADSFAAGNSHIQARESLDFLAQYTIEHFQTEEHWMQEMGYPGLMAHAAEHGRLVGKVQLLQDGLSEGKPITMDTTIFLAKWLKTHICGTDMAYVRFSQELSQE